jgi:hypothetical protein
MKISVKDQLFYLKGLTEQLGVVHEAQLLQIRNYPLLIPNIKKAETELNIDTKTIVYKCQSEGRFKKTKQTKLAISKIQEWIRYVVWNETIIIIQVDGKEIYDSRLQ